MKAGPVFADTGIFIAFLDRSDHYHQAALRLFADPPRRWCTSLAVVAETYGWFLYRLGEESARTFRVALADLPRLELLALAREFAGKERNFTGEHFWARGYAVSTVGFNLEQVTAYIRAQEAEDELGRF